VCSYPLTDLPDGICPECGLALSLKLALTKPRQRVYVAGLIGLGAGLGFHGLILLYFVWMTWLDGSGFGPDWEEIIPLLVGLGVASPALFVWARSWGHFQRCARLAGVLLAVICWAFSIGTAVWFFVWVD